MVGGADDADAASFLGAEATRADSGPFAGICAFEDEERAGLALMRSLSAEKRRRATVAHSMKGGDLPEERWHFADHLHLGGTARDNRIVPYEGLPGTRMSTTEKRGLVDLVATYLAPLPPVRSPRESIRSNVISTRLISAGSAASKRTVRSTTGFRAR